MALDFVFAIGEEDTCGCGDITTVVYVTEKDYWEENKFIQDRYDEKHYKFFEEFFGPLNIHRFMESSFEAPDYSPDTLKRILSQHEQFTYSEAFQQFIDETNED